LEKWVKGLGGFLSSEVVMTRSIIPRVLMEAQIFRPSIIPVEGIMRILCRAVGAEATPIQKTVRFMPIPSSTHPAIPIYCNFKRLDLGPKELQFI